MSQIPEIIAGDSKECSEVLKKIILNYGLSLNNLGRTNQNGLFYCSAVDSLIGVDGSQYSYIERIINDPQHKTVLSQAIMFEYTDRTEYLVALHVPVWNQNKEFSGTLGGAIYINDLEKKYLEDLEFVKKGYVFIIDNNGNILFHKNPELRGQNINEIDLEEEFGSPLGFKEMLLEAQSGLTGTNEHYHNNVKNIAAYAKSSVAKDQYWSVIVHIPTTEIINSIDLFISSLRTLIFGILGFLIFIFISIIIYLKKINYKLKAKILSRTAELKRAKDRSETLLSSVGEGVFGVNQRQEIIYFNKAAERISGYKSSEVEGKPYYKFIKFISHKNKDEDFQFIRDALEGKDAHSDHSINHSLFIDRNSKEIPVDKSAYPIKDDNNIILGAIIIFRDITNDVELTKSRSELISFAGHQLKAPLTYLSGNIEILKENQLNNETKKIADELDKGVIKMKELVSNLLNISQIEQGEIKLKLEPIQLKDIIDDILRETSSNVEQQGIKLQFRETEKFLPEIMADPKFVREIFKNIISNAIKYTKDSINISLEKKGGNILFICSDNGIGIPKSEQSRIFEKFYTASNISKASVTGTGLGLNIAKLLVEKMNGKIWFESEENKKTIFFIELPIV